MAVRASLKNKLSSEINVTPMADVMLVLLVIFMLATPLFQKDVLVNLPRAQNPLDIENGPMVLALNREGRIYCDRRLVTEEEMIQAVRERMADEGNKTMFLRADQALAYGKVVRIINECRSAGVDRVGLMTEKESKRN
jgi:biopolymer transport protein TolR